MKIKFPSLRYSKILFLFNNNKMKESFESLRKQFWLARISGFLFDKSANLTTCLRKSLPTKVRIS